MKLEKEKDCKLEDLKIPRGYRLLEDWEVLKESRTNNEVYELLKEGGIWCNTHKGKRAAGFIFIDGDFLVYGGINIGNTGRSRGVFVKK